MLCSSRPLQAAAIVCEGTEEISGTRYYKEGASVQKAHPLFFVNVVQVLGPFHRRASCFLSSVITHVVRSTERCP